MMEFKCRHCKKIITRDESDPIFSKFATKRGYKSTCENTNKDTFLIPLDQNGYNKLIGE
jgi:hypothetical protein